ncbi:hypothetical protein CVIRNUC_001410 [Coccomyxa viridis]|uniref:Uncharacterized protein n=1 Tax=Coccomyxa viridis TaxID=1274662 RepID=A0AAV1HUF7_9CHLO|nr:hypothetical protein CVIRNUC_001410 [Coccomyxa viridis]
MGLLFWKKKRKPEDRPSEAQQELHFAPRREELQLPARTDPAVFEFPSPNGEGMTGICNIEPADNISACVWRLQDTQPSEERKDQKLLYHIEF